MTLVWLQPLYSLCFVIIMYVMYIYIYHTVLKNAPFIYVYVATNLTTYLYSDII